MKKLTRLLLISLLSSFLGTVVCAAERLEMARGTFAVKSAARISRMESALMKVSAVNLSERLVLTPKLIKGGASLGVNLSF